MTRGSLIALLVASGAVSAARAQLPVVTGYALNVGLAIDDGPFNDRGLFDTQRLRLMTAPTVGALAWDLAYEHSASVSSAAGGPSFAAGIGQARSGGEWLPLQGMVEETEHLSWRHRVDRLAVTFALEHVEVTVGRQPISWATTLSLTPADPFVPFDPSEPFREYRAGVDALRLRVFPGPFSEVDVVVRPGEYAGDETLTALARGRGAMGRWEVAGWAGVVHDDAAASLAATVTLGGAVVRAEGVLRRSEGETVGRWSVGADRSFVVAGRTLYVVLQYQRDGFGAAGADDLPAVALSTPMRRGELQVLGRDVGALQASYALHPLVSASALALWSVGDGSVLAAPAVTYSVSGEATAGAGVFAGFGDGLTGPGLPGSEFGVVPLMGYVSLTLFF